MVVVVAVPTLLQALSLTFRYSCQDIVTADPEYWPPLMLSLEYQEVPALAGDSVVDHVD
jgi:hypothetical protein